MSLRGKVNDALGGLASKRTNRRAYERRTLLVANNWDGSVQQFYHFLFGYLMPVALWVKAHPNKPIMMRDCGPMNTWLTLVAERVNLEIVPPGAALHIVVGDRMAHEVLKGMDFPSDFDKGRLLAGADALRELIGAPRGDSKAPGRTIIIDRVSSEDFYHGPDSETHMSGGERRSTPNLAQLTGFVPAAEIVDLARVDPREQIELMESATTLVAQHGAGLAHMIWMPQGSLIVEVSPPLPEQVFAIFEQFASCLGHRYVRVLQESVHAPVDLEALSNATKG